MHSVASFLFLLLSAMPGFRIIACHCLARDSGLFRDYGTEFLAELVQLLKHFLADAVKVRGKILPVFAGKFLLALLLRLRCIVYLVLKVVVKIYGLVDDAAHFFIVLARIEHYKQGAIVDELTDEILDVLLDISEIHGIIKLYE